MRKQQHHCDNNALAEVSVQGESKGSRQGRLLTLARFSKIARIDGDFRTSSGPTDPIAPTPRSQKGSLFLTRLLLFHYIARREALEASASELFNVVASGKVRMNVDQRFALEDAADADKAWDARAISGSTILTISPSTEEELG